MRLNVGQVHRLSRPPMRMGRRGMGQSSTIPGATITQTPGTSGPCSYQVNVPGAPGPIYDTDCWATMPYATQQTLQAVYPNLYSAANGYVVGTGPNAPPTGALTQQTSYVEQGGVVTATSGPGAGTSFQATPPLQAQPISAPSAPAGNVTQQQLTGTQTTAPVATGFDLTGWLTTTSIDSIPNWVLLAGGAVLIWWMMSRRR